MNQTYDNFKTQAFYFNEPSPSDLS